MKQSLRTKKALLLKSNILQKKEREKHRNKTQDPIPSTLNLKKEGSQ